MIKEAVSFHAPLHSVRAEVRVSRTTPEVELFNYQHPGAFLVILSRRPLRRLLPTLFSCKRICFNTLQVIFSINQLFIIDQ